jgi:C-terminal processing protease CtpA/Prc
VAILKAIDPDKLQMKLIAPVNASGPPPDYLSHLDRNFWLKKLDDSTLYVQFNQFVDEPSKTLDRFAIELHHAVMEHAVRNVVVDLRLNNGGDYSSTLSILKALFAFEMGRPDSRLFVVVGRNTESAAQNFASTLDEFGHVIIVGEPSGSKPNHVGDDTLVVLPYSGIIASIACAIHQTEFRDERQWIAGDIPISLSSDAYFSQRDPTMEAIAEVIKHD